ncbi:MAG: hypothetical protein ACJ754_16790 [Pyrinomonadaceae bacterium]
MNWDGFLVVIPNATIYTEKLTILNAYDARRTGVEFVVGFRDDLDEARRLIVEALGGVDGVLKEPGPSAICTGIAANGICVRARWWTDSKHADDVAVTDRAIPAIKNRLFENGIEIAYPTHQVLFHDQTEEVDGDRRRQRAGWPAGQGGVPRQRRLGDVLSQLTEIVVRGNGNGGSASDSGAESRG